MAFVTEDGDVIKAADVAASEVESRGKTAYVGSTKLISIRIPAHLIIQAQAMASISAKSRNAMISTLIEVGLEEVRERLDAVTLHELDALEAELSEALTEEE